MLIYFMTYFLCLCFTTLECCNCP